MSTRIPKAWETSWAQDAIRAETVGPTLSFKYSGHDAKVTDQVVYLVGKDCICQPVDAGLVRSEKWRVDQTKNRSAVAVGCSDQVVPAPARGDVDEYREGYWVGEGCAAEWRTSPYRSGCPGIVRDVFDEMTDQVARRGGDAPFTKLQVGTARDYRDLHEWVQKSGVKCSSTFDAGVGGGGDRDFIALYMAKSQRLRMFQAAIADGVAKAPRQKPVGARVTVTNKNLKRVARQIITVRALVDAVCLSDKTLSAVLVRYGWSVDGKNRNTLSTSLGGALDRMRGI